MALARAAESLLGTKFRLNGRDPGSGLDCVGLLEAALNRCGHQVQLPVGYRLHVSAIDFWLPKPESIGLCTADGPSVPGDVVLLQPGAAQAHLVILGPDSGFIHAHAGLRRVVRAPQMPSGPVLGRWRAGSSNGPVKQR